MELTHDFIVPAPVDTAWSTFMDLERVGNCFPGATVTEATGETFAGTVKVKLGPIALVYAGSGLFLERDDAAHRAVIEAKGKDKRGNGTAGATVTLQLAPAEGGAATRVDVTTELAITGKPAQFGRGVMQDVSDKLLQQFVGCIEGQFAESATEDSPSESTAGPAAGPAADPAAGPDAQAANPAADSATGSSGADDAGLMHGVPLPQYREAVADGEGMALPPDEIAEDKKVAAAAGAAAAAPVPRHTATAPRPSSAADKATRGDDSVDLGATVLPVLIKAYAPHAIGALVAVALGYVLGRRSRRR